MLLLKYLLLAAGIGLFAGAAAIIAYDVYVAAQLRRLLGSGEAAEPGAEPARPVGLIRPVRWSVAGKLTRPAGVAPLVGAGIGVVPGRQGGGGGSPNLGGGRGAGAPRGAFVFPSRLHRGH